MDGIRESFVCEGVGGCVWGGARVPTRSGRENAPEGRHWPIRKQRRLSRRGHPGASVALWSRKGGRSGPLVWNPALSLPSFEELRERIGKSRLQQKGESESESFLGGKREDLDRA
jgi:hypothetical protein